MVCIHCVLRAHVQELEKSLVIIVAYLWALLGVSGGEILRSTCLFFSKAISPCSCLTSYLLE